MDYDEKNIYISRKLQNIYDDYLKRILKKEIEKYNINTSIYIINGFLGEEQYSEKNYILLLKGYKILIINTTLDEENNNIFREDFVDDLDSEAKKFEYRETIGRKRKWDYLIESIPKSDLLRDGLEKYRFNKEQGKDKRLGEFLISLITGSINDIKNLKIDLPTTDLEKVKQNIRIFDSNQTRFIFSEEKDKVIRIQGLAGTGKTELLLNKLRELYSKKEEYKIAFTCHNKILATELKKRIPEFFNFMKVDRQIEWNENFWVFNGWGSRNLPNSGLYSYICNFYAGSFYPFTPSGISFEELCKRLLVEIKEKQGNKQQYCFDYLFVDESQDFGDDFIKLCEYVTRKMIYIAGDVFQNIFTTIDTTKNINYILDKCYRTDPKTLMLAHAMGMGLCEKTIPLNWLEDDEWLLCGYKISRTEGKLVLSRGPIDRFEGVIQEQGVDIVGVGKCEIVDEVMNKIEIIKNTNEDFRASDLAIAFISSSSTNYCLADELKRKIKERFGLESILGFNVKEIKEDYIFISNINNIKGLEFPFLIYFEIGKISQDYKKRSQIYTLLTRSFIKTVMILNNDIEENKAIIENYSSLDLKSNNGVVELSIIEPTDDEKVEIKRNAKLGVIKSTKSLKEIIEQICRERGYSQGQKKRALTLEDFIKNEIEVTEGEDRDVYNIVENIIVNNIGVDNEI